MTGQPHKIRSVTVNLLHLWECRRCGRRWLPGKDPDATNCPGRLP